MVYFDSYISNSQYEKSYDLINPSSYIEHDIEVRYSKELAYLQEIKNYKEGWDSYNGLVPNEKSIRSGIRFLLYFTIEFKKSNILSHFPEFCLAPDGVLGIEWDYAKNSNLFARLYSPDKIEYVLTKNKNKQTPQEATSEEFIEICKEKLQCNQVA